MTTAISTTFDYGDLPEPEARAMERYAEAIVGVRNKLRREYGESALEIGRQLAEAHERYANRRNGCFEKWVNDRLEISPQHARRFITAFRFFSQQDYPNNVVRLFDESAMFLVAAESCPPDARKEALKIALSGGVVSHKLAASIVEKHKPKPADETGYSPHGTGAKKGSGKKASAAPPPAADRKPAHPEPPPQVIEPEYREVAEPEDTDVDWLRSQLSPLSRAARKLPEKYEPREEVANALHHALEVLMGGISPYRMVSASSDSE